MNDETRVFGLTCSAQDASAPVLASVEAVGRLDGVLFELTLRQTYRNTSERLLEVVYTFPLPHQAVLLGFASELNGERKAGTIVARREAEHQYEEALAEGDAPVMLEALDGGSHTANIGNLKPGDELLLEVRFAQLLAFEQGRLRVAIPTTIAPRYGGAEQSGLQPQQVPQASLEAEYPLRLSVVVAGALAGCAMECPTHRVTRGSVEDGVRLTLDEGAWLDRDVVILVQPREALPSLVVQAHDAVSRAAPVVVMAAFQPPLAPQRERLALKLLIDCSGSMAGDSIASARAALDGALAGLGEQDQVSVSRFGSTVEHLQLPATCVPDTVRRLRCIASAIQADLGGTEMEVALRSVFALTAKADVFGADVLLFTDGEIWQAEETIAAARASEHRVFVIGVGSSPAEGVLRSLAEATGGACEFATPGEALEAAARRMLVRIRQRPWRNARVDWGTEPVWQTALPASVFGGDTVITFAGMAAMPPSARVRLLTNDGHETAVELARNEAHAPSPGSSLSRIAATRRMALADEPQALALAIDYQLLSKQTHCILVHVRGEADRSAREAELYRVDSMLAAGWGATASVAALAGGRVRMSLVDTSISYCMNVSYADNSANSSAPDDQAQGDKLNVVVFAVTTHFSDGGTVEDLAAISASLTLDPEIRAALDQAVGIGASESHALLMLAHWENSRPFATSDSSAPAALQAYVDEIDAGVLAKCLGLFDRLLGGGSRGIKARQRRLQRAIARADASGGLVI